MLDIVGYFACNGALWLCVRSMKIRPGKESMKDQIGIGIAGLGKRRQGLVGEMSNEITSHTSL